MIGLIECFCDPEKGLNEYEDNPLTQLNVQWYRDQIGIVSQEPRYKDQEAIQGAKNLSSSSVVLGAAVNDPLMFCR